MEFACKGEAFADKFSLFIDLDSECFAPKRFSKKNLNFFLDSRFHGNDAVELVIPAKAGIHLLTICQIES